MKLNITKGKVNISEHKGSFVVWTGDHVFLVDVWKVESIEEARANASLIAESFNVANETGLTPRQLLEKLSTAIELLSISTTFLRSSMWENSTRLGRTHNETEKILADFKHFKKVEAFMSTPISNPEN